MLWSFVKWSKLTLLITFVLTILAYLLERWSDSLKLCSSQESAGHPLKTPTLYVSAFIKLNFFKFLQLTNCRFDSPTIYSRKILWENATCKFCDCLHIFQGFL